MSIENEARQQFAEEVGATLDRICADLGITPENDHEHTLRKWTTPGGQWHYYVDGALVMIVDPATHWIEGRIENRAYREAKMAGDDPQTKNAPRPTAGDISPRTAAFAAPGARPMDNLPRPGWRARIRMRLRQWWGRMTDWRR